MKMGHGRDLAMQSLKSLFLGRVCPYHERSAKVLQDAEGKLRRNGLERWDRMGELVYCGACISSGNMNE